MAFEFFSQIPAGFQAWSPPVQAAALFLGTFVLEDVTAVGAGLLLAGGALAWPTAFLACFLGIWLGDAGLYALARYGGRNWFEKSRFNRFAGRVARSEVWFAERGNVILIFSRLLPGARLPTYLAAGFLRVPAARFLVITGAASLVWTIIILAVTHFVGNRALNWVQQWRHGGWVLFAALGLSVLVAGFIRSERVNALARRFSIACQRWAKWEFWPAWLFYPPVALNWLRLGLKYRGLTLPTAANPGIYSGGLVGESKAHTLRELSATSPEFTAASELLTGDSPGERLASLRRIMTRHGFTYPLILKPDFGQRGVGVKLVRDEAQATAYFRQTNAPLLAQAYSPGPHEVGVFYYRFPHESRGHIFAITEKIFPYVTGDGCSTVAELINRDPRARLIATKYLARLGGRRREVLPAGESLKLVEAGNHAQGCIFQDGAALITPALIERIDEISQRLTGFHIGRYDIRYSSPNELCSGQAFQIIELNGAASEATNIYDARTPLWRAYQTLFRQWELVFAIGAANRAAGARSMRPLEIWRAWRKFARAAATYPPAD